MYTKIIRRCGIVLIVVGVLDIAYMIWCIANQVSYSSSFNVFALVGGILLVHGGLKTARWVAQLSTFMLVACGGILLVMPFMYPFGYFMAVLRHGSGLILSLGFAVALFALLIWVRQQVMHPEVRQAQLAAGLPPPRIKQAVAVGTALPLLIVTLLGFMFRSASAREAIRRAEQQLGGSYRYVVTNMQMQSNMNGKSVFAIVAAYNDTELKSIEISWKE
jgi:hypothetical protein